MHFLTAKVGNFRSPDNPNIAKFALVEVIKYEKNILGEQVERGFETELSFKKLKSAGSYREASERHRSEDAGRALRILWRYIH